jgi:hypothetical protein
MTKEAEAKVLELMNQMVGARKELSRLEGLRDEVEASLDRVLADTEKARLRVQELSREFSLLLTEEAAKK